MENEVLREVKSILSKIEKVSNKTHNKIDVLKQILVEYNSLSDKHCGFKGFPLTEQITSIDLAKTKRKNVGKKYIHGEFLRIKEEALFRIKHNYALMKHPLNQDEK